MGLKKLNWSRSLTAKSPIHAYQVRTDGEVDGKFIVKKTRLETGQTETVTGFDSVEAAQDWCYYKHYLPKMQPWLEPDSVTDIVNWFKAAKPEPTIKDVMVQYGCHIEEVCESLVATGDYDEARELELLADFYKTDNFADVAPNGHGNINILDALCDQIVTAIGVGYMMGFDMHGALVEVIRSNNSKMIDGKFIFDENGKIAKPSSYSEPQLDQFLNKGDR